MLKKSLNAFFLFFIFSVISASAQSTTNTKSLQPDGFISIEMNPSLIVVVDSVYHKVDTKKADEIDTDWIEKVVVMKDEITNKMYGNKNGVIFVYTLQQYKTEVLEVIESTEPKKGS